MNEAAIRERILELSDTLLASPTFGATNVSVSSSDGIYLPAETDKAVELEGCIDQLRLQMKYLLFDLEATKRENRYLRQMLQGRGKRENGEQ